MRENVFIIGNGFDLDLGLPTAYSNFVSSKYWPIPINKKKTKNNREILDLSPNQEIPTLENVIEKAKLETWFDLEETLLNYAKVESKGNLYHNSWGIETGLEIANNVKYYKRIQKALCKYIKHVQKKFRVNEASSASKVLKAVIDNGLFENIFSFNYTDLNAIAKQLNISADFRYVHLHGKVSDNSIILGVDESYLRPGYEVFHKTSSRKYPSNDLYDALINATEIVVFGLSFGSIDYSYFKDFFKNISEGKPIPKNRKQHITIFTKDYDSFLKTVTRFRAMNIDIQKLKAQAYFDIICTSDNKDKDKLENFYMRLKEFDKEAIANKQYDFPELLPQNGY